VEKYGRTRQATDDSIIRCMRFACWITKATHTHSEYVITVAFPWHSKSLLAGRCGLGGRLLTGIAGSNPIWGVNICVVCFK
jgi:hypothetical protein